MQDWEGERVVKDWDQGGGWDNNEKVGVGGKIGAWGGLYLVYGSYFLSNLSYKHILLEHTDHH